MKNFTKPVDLVLSGTTRIRITEEHLVELDNLTEIHIDLSGTCDASMARMLATYGDRRFCEVIKEDK